MNLSEISYIITTEIVNFYLDVKFQCNSLEGTDIRCDGAFNSSVKSYASSRRWQCNSLLTRGLYSVKIKLKFVFKICASSSTGICVLLSNLLHLLYG